MTDAPATHFTLTCSCGWTHEAASRKATNWKQWHRRHYQQAGQRLSESGHQVTVKKKETA